MGFGKNGGPSCAHCGDTRPSSVTNSRTEDRFGIRVVMRRRECGACGDRWTTFEVPAKAMTDIMFSDARRALAAEMISSLSQQFMPQKEDEK